MKLHRKVVSETLSGERFTFSELESEREMEHIHRYVLASRVCEGKDVLDAACGEGFGSAILADRAKSVLGIDIDVPTIRRARENYRDERLHFEVHSAQNLPYQSSCFDVVVSFETIEHISDHDVVMAEFARVLRPDGILIISSPDRERYNIGLREANPFHVHELSQDEFLELIDRHFECRRSFGQRIVFGSLITSSTDPRVKLESIRRSSQDDEIRAEAFQLSSIYHIVVCGKSEIPDLQSSIYEGAVPPNALSSLMGGIVERDETILRLQAQIADIERERSAFEGGCRERDVIIAAQQNRIVDVERERGAFEGGCRERDEIIVAQRELLASRE